MSLGDRFPEIIQAARDSDDAAWGEIYMEFSAALFGYLRSRAYPEAEDLLGETFYQAVRDVGRFEGSESDFRAWLFTIARHRLIDQRRRSGRRPEQPVPVEDLVGTADSGDVEDEALARLSTDHALRLVATLSDDQQDVVMLRLMADLSIDEVARVLGKSPGAVKQLQRRALAALQREMSGSPVTPEAPATLSEET